MDQLEILKKDWKKQNESFPKLSKEELSKLLQKKSSSIVKWIFIISVLEFVLPFLALTIPGFDNSFKTYENLGLKNFITGFYIIYYIIILFFIYKFYKNYRTISVSSKPKELMFNIINTRKTVKYYIWFNLSAAAVLAIVILIKTFGSEEFISKIPEDTNMTIIWLISLLLVAVVIFLFWLFYMLLYGILLNRLKKNYNELISNGHVEL